MTADSDSSMTDPPDMESKTTTPVVIDLTVDTDDDADVDEDDADDDVDDELHDYAVAPPTPFQFDVQRELEASERLLADLIAWRDARLITPPQPITLRSMCVTRPTPTPICPELARPRWIHGWPLKKVARKLEF